jgi:hypothetical protein
VNGTLTAPEFRRLLELRGEDAVVVDLVRDYAVRVVPEKLVLGKVRVDAVEEIFANKVCALLSPAEIRDLVDGICTERSRPRSPGGDSGRHAQGPRTHTGTVGGGYSARSILAITRVCPVPFRPTSFASSCENWSPGSHWIHTRRTSPATVVQRSSGTSSATAR